MKWSYVFCDTIPTLRKIQTTLVRIVSVQTENRSRCMPNTNQECQPFHHDFHSSSRGTLPRLRSLHLTQSYASDFCNVLSITERRLFSAFNRTHTLLHDSVPTTKVTRYTVPHLTGRPGFDPRRKQRIFPLPSASRPALGPTQPPIQWVPGALSPGVKPERGVMLTTHPLLVPRLRKSRSYTSCHSNEPLWSVTGPLYHTFIHRVIEYGYVQLLSH
jgi:hypothetical protein